MRCEFFLRCFILSPIQTEKLEQIYNINRKLSSRMKIQYRRHIVTIRLDQQKPLYTQEKLSAKKEDKTEQGSLFDK